MSFAPFCSGKFHLLINSFGSNHGCKFLNFQFRVPLVRSVNIRTRSRRLLTTKVEGRNQSSQSNKPCNINLKLDDKHTKKAEVDEYRSVQCYNIQQISGKKEFEWPATIIVIDIETTGFHREKERIVEIALRDLLGGKNSTFQTLVNPGRVVGNWEIHGIRTAMVNRPGVPSFKELVPILLKFIRSRQIDGKPTLFVAHNGRRFDVPFIIAEFRRSGQEIPGDWLFLDTYPLARQLVMQDGSKLPTAKLESLREHYKIPLVGPAHRAMQDVNTLSYVLQRITVDLKLTIPDLLERAFRASDVTKAAVLAKKKRRTKAAP